jgi:hypothetical protein
MTESHDRRKRLRRLGLVAVAVGLAASSALVGFSLAAFSDTTSNSGNSFSAATSFCGSAGTQTLVADADSYIDENAQASNFGNSVSLQVQSRQGGRNRRALVHFPLPVAPFCSVTSATLRLRAVAGDAGRTLQAYQGAAPWIEGTVSWLTQPPIVGSPATTTSVSSGWIQFDVTAQAQLMLKGVNAGFQVKDAAEGQNPASGQTFTSREGATNRPELVVTLA